MDPEAALKQIRSLVESIKECIDEHDDINNMDRDNLEALAGEADELVNTFDGLDQWMSRGGFLPRSWAEGRK